MAISLSNHEDRIKKLEEPFKCDMLVHHDFGSSTEEYVMHKSDYDKYDILLFFADAARNSADTKGYGCYRGVSSIPTKVIFNHAPTAFTPGFTYEVYHDNNLVRCETFECSVNYEFDLIIRAVMISNDWSDNRMIVYGLKLYYNFSYNIYRLANFISFHFSKMSDKFIHLKEV